MDSTALLLAATLSAGTVLAIAALGLLINEKAGIVNLGAEGMMLCAALAGFATVVHTGNSWLGFGAGMLAGALLAALFGVLVIWLNTNQYATGLALSLFGAGFSAFAGTRYVQEKLPEQSHYPIPFLADLPFAGPAFFRQHPMVYLTIALTLGLIWFLYRTRAGLVLRSVGESPESAHALGYPVRRIRMAAVMVGGALCHAAVDRRQHASARGADEAQSTHAEFCEAREFLRPGFFRHQRHAAKTVRESRQRVFQHGVVAPVSAARHHDGARQADFLLQCDQHFGRCGAR